MKIILMDRFSVCCKPLYGDFFVFGSKLDIFISEIIYFYCGVVGVIA